MKCEVRKCEQEGAAWYVTQKVPGGMIPMLCAKLWLCPVCAAQRPLSQQKPIGDDPARPPALPWDAIASNVFISLIVVGVFGLMFLAGPTWAHWCLIFSLPVVLIALEWWARKSYPRGERRTFSLSGPIENYRGVAQHVRRLTRNRNVKCPSCGSDDLSFLDLRCGCGCSVFNPSLERVVSAVVGVIGVLVFPFIAFEWLDGLSPRIGLLPLYYVTVLALVPSRWMRLWVRILCGLMGLLGIIFCCVLPVLYMVLPESERSSADFLSPVTISVTIILLGSVWLGLRSKWGWLSMLSAIYAVMIGYDCWQMLLTTGFNNGLLPGFVVTFRALAAGHY